LPADEDLPFHNPDRTLGVKLTPEGGIADAQEDGSLLFVSVGDF